MATTGQCRGQGFPVEIVDNIEQAVAPAIRKLVMHEIHRPALVDGFRDGERFRGDYRSSAWHGRLFELENLTVRISGTGSKRLVD
jgi:hypothetical protein